MNQVRFGIVGLGSMGLDHAETILRDGKEARLCAVATGSAEHAGRLRALPGGEAVHVFATPEQMYESGEIDAVLIATPHRLHAGQAAKAFEAGIHVLLEKPTGVCTKEVRALHQVADRSGLAFGVMFNVRTNPAYARMKRIVSSGELGEIRRTSVIVTDILRAQSYYDAGVWRATWKQDGGGVLLNQAPHNLDLWQWICGMPVRVRAFCGFGRWHDIEVEDDVTAYVEYKNGATGTFIACTGEVPGTNRFEISLDGGQLVYEGGRLKMTTSRIPAGRFIREFEGGFGKPETDVQDITPDSPNPMHAGVIRAFARHILYGEEMVADGREGLCSLELSNAMLLSSWTGNTVELPFDDDLFARMLEERAAKSPEKQAKPIRLNVRNSF